MKIIIRILHKLGVVKGIFLQDHTLEIYTTIKKQNEFNDIYAHVYPFLKVGYVILNKDGTCSGPSIYIKKWLDM